MQGTPYMGGAPMYGRQRVELKNMKLGNKYGKAYFISQPCILYSHELGSTLDAGPRRAHAQSIVSSYTGPWPRAPPGGLPMSEYTIQILMLAATVCGLAPSYGLTLRAAFGHTQS